MDNKGLYSLKNGPALPGCFIINNTHRCMPIYTNVSDLNSNGMIFRNQNGWVLGALKGIHKVIGYVNYGNDKYTGNQVVVTIGINKPNDYIAFSTKYQAGSVRIFRDDNTTIEGSNVI